VGCLCIALAGGRAAVAQNAVPEAQLDRIVASAEESLRAGERQVAESRYRTALFEGWMLLGVIHASSGRLEDARLAFERASSSAAENRTALNALATLRLKTGESGRAIQPLTNMAPPAADRDRVADHVRATLARIYLNLGVMHAQAERFARAAELFEEAVQIDPAFPQAQYSLGVAYFNAQRYDKAALSLTRALEQQPRNADARRMLALAWMNGDEYARAADLLRDDPARGSNPSLQYAYGLALVRSARAQEAQEIFSRLLAEHPDVPELNVVLGQAYAAQGDYETAVTSLRRAIELDPRVTDANAALGVIYLKQGRLSAAAEALRAELASHPGDLKARYTLATVLDLDGHSDDALAELRAIVAVRPTYADARYLLGKILLAHGSSADAVAHLEMAARLSPEDANVHYQLGQAYQRLGRTELATREFETFQKLKDKKRGGAP
jgi:Flp pilus assembly protein TadD